MDDYVYCTNEVAYYLKDKKIRFVGVDYITIGNQKDLENIKIVHETLLSNGIYIIEMLNLDGVKPGTYEMVCLPLRMEKVMLVHAGQSLDRYYNISLCY